MEFSSRRGIGLVSSLLTLTIIGAFLAAVGLLLSQERARVRDAGRMVDMLRVQFAFETMFREKGSYADAANGCPEVGSPVSNCALAPYLPLGTSLSDPSKRSYRVERVPDNDDFAVSFSLERGYGTLTKGTHYVTRNGIQ